MLGNIASHYFFFGHSRVAQFDQLPAEDGTVDLVTVSQAVHWFRPIENFYKEVDRVLRPGGCLAVYEYGRSQYINHPNVEELSQAYKEVQDLLPRFLFIREKQY